MSYDDFFRSIPTLKKNVGWDENPLADAINYQIRETIRENMSTGGNPAPAPLVDFENTPPKIGAWMEKEPESSNEPVQYNPTQLEVSTFSGIPMTTLASHYTQVTTRPELPVKGELVFEAEDGTRTRRIREKDPYLQNPNAYERLTN